MTAVEGQYRRLRNLDAINMIADAKFSLEWVF